MGFSRTYSSLTAPWAASTLAPYGNLGPGWSFNYNTFATKDSSGNVTIQSPDASQIVYGAPTVGSSIAVTSASESGSTVTLNFGTQSSAPTGIIVVSEFTPSGYDGAYQIATSTTNSLTYAAVSGLGTVTTDGKFSGGYIQPRHVLSWLLPNDGQVLAPQCPSSATVLVTHGQTKIAYYQVTASPPTGQPLGALCEELDINGYPTETTFDSSKRLTTVTAYTDWNGSSYDASLYLTLAYSGSSTEISSVTSSAGTGTGTLQETYGYNGSSELANATDADSDETRYTYNNEGLLSAVQTPDQYAASSSGTGFTYDTSGRLRYAQDAADVAAGIPSVTSYTYQCSVSGGTCSADGTQTSTLTDPLGNQTQFVFADGMMTSETQGVGTSVAATHNRSYDQNTLGVTTSIAPANGSGASYEISYANWYGLTSGSYGNLQCSVAPGSFGSTYTVTGASQSSGIATLTFSTSTAPIVGATIVVSGVTNGAYDGTFQVTASSTTSVSYAVSGSPGPSSGGSFQQIQGNVTSYTYNNFNETVTETNPDEQAISYAGACNTGTPTYTSTNYYGSAGSGTCTANAPDPWLLACTVKQTGGTPANSTTNYGYGGAASGGGTDSNIGDVTSTTDPDGNLTVSAYDTHGNVTDSYTPGQSGYTIVVTGGSCTSGTATLDFGTTVGTPNPAARLSWFALTPPAPAPLTGPTRSQAPPPAASRIPSRPAPPPIRAGELSSSPRPRPSSPQRPTAPEPAMRRSLSRP